MTSRIRGIPILLLAFVVACTDQPPVAPVSAGGVAYISAPASLTGNGASRLSAESRNLYIGANVDAVIAALRTPETTDDVPALLEAITTVGKTAYPLRAEALADEIARGRPEVVGLQEVSEIHINIPPFGIAVNQDFLSILMAALNARGLHYVLVGQSTNLVATPFPGVAVTDHDALLRDADRVTVNGPVVATTYAANLGHIAPGVDLNRGYVVAPLLIDGEPVTVATTHLESGDVPGFAELRAFQAQELVAVVGIVGGGAPAMLLGDFNDTPGSPMYQVVTGAGFTDSWGAMRPGARGLTCCEAADLSNHTPVLIQRIDYVFARGIGGPNGKLLGQISIIGDQPADKIAGPAFPIWPSDHAGVVASFLRVPAVP